MLKNKMDHYPLACTLYGSHRARIGIRRFSCSQSNVGPECEGGGAVSGGGVDQAYDGWRVVSQISFAEEISFTKQAKHQSQSVDGGICDLPKLGRLANMPTRRCARRWIGRTRDVGALRRETLRFRQWGGQMKTILRLTAALYLFCASTLAFAGNLPGGTGSRFVVGYNEAWFGQNYGNSIASNPSVFCLTSSFDPIFVDKMFAGMQAGGAQIVRLWVFPALQGIELGPRPPQQCLPLTPQTMDLTQDLIGNPQGNPPTVGNLEKVFLAAQSHHLMVYVTALNGNDMTVASTNITGLRPYFQNLLTNTNGELDRFKEKALLPLVTLMNKYKDSKLIYAFDLMNDIEAALNSGYFPDGWSGARNWIQNVTAYVKSIPCGVNCVTGSWLPVTSSAGGSYAGLEIIFGLFSGLSLDFYDLHAYADWGLYPGLTALCNRVPIILGEYGQTSQTLDDWLQYWTTYNFLTTAKTHCFSAALAWKYDICESQQDVCSALQPSDNWWTYLIPDPTCLGTAPDENCSKYGGTFRPAYYLIH